MRLKGTAIALALALGANPAFAGSDTRHLMETRKPNPRAIAALDTKHVKFELVAVSARARADNKLRADHLHECKAFNKILPGYPQPAVMSVDLRVRF